MTETSPYRVLARKHRPTAFAEVIGQDALTRTLANALSSKRLAHAYLLAGMRGCGKTSTARILARALNCEQGPTATPCGRCKPCLDILAERHLDVFEMDAASNTGVDDVRELIDRVPYAPTQGRYKVTIIDEAHMLSKGAFNALLKTLEEPPPHTVFIFATTEPRKIPLTILSRCQRFDLRRVDMETLQRHYADIAKRENAEIDAEALALVARAADGSVRDGLSILDQAIGAGNGKVDGALVRAMLGLADRAQSVAAADAALAGDAPKALKAFRAATLSGADPTAALRDALEYVHLVGVASAAPNEAEDPSLSEAERQAAKTRAKTVSAAQAHQAWQILVKGVADLNAAPDPKQSAEMALLRVAALFAKQA